MGRKTISCAASLTLSPHGLNLRKLSLHRNRHINNLISVLLLVNLDALGFLVDLLWCDRSFFSLSGLLDDSVLLHFDCVDEVLCATTHYENECDFDGPSHTFSDSGAKLSRH